MTNDDPCLELRREVDEAQAEWELVLAGENQVSAVMGGDLGSRFYESISQQEAASRRYRSAVRALAECLRQHQPRPGIIGSTHE